MKKSFAIIFVKKTAVQDSLICWNDFPELASLCWNRHTSKLTESMALQLYETNWAFLDQKKMPSHEKEFVRHLAKTFASHLHV